MSGKLLIVDNVSTNRMTMKTRLSGAFYDVSQAQNLTEARQQIWCNAPDLLMINAKMPDEDPLRFCRNLRASPKTAHLPVLLLTAKDDRGYRIRALKAGADDVLVRPVESDILLPRLRSLMRRNEYNDDSLVPEETARALGLAENQTGFEARASVLIATQDSTTAALWTHLLKAKAPYDFSAQILDDALRSVTQSPAPDVFVIMPDAAQPDVSLRLIAEIRARSATRHSSVLVVLTNQTQSLHGDALDLGAQDVMKSGFDAEEMALRISKLVQHKRLTDRLRDNLKNGLHAAVTDPLTGLFNRRYALTHLARIAEQAAVKDGSFAVMMADLDRFKCVNDRFGHKAGDAVLIETANRLRSALRPVDLVARLGGEEFLIAMPDVTQHVAKRFADQVCTMMRNTPVQIPGMNIGLPITLSVGVTLGGNHNYDRSIERLIQTADQALYSAKSKGRDQFAFG